MPNWQRNRRIKVNQRSLAAAGHDLVQPFNAASLFFGTLLQRFKNDNSQLALQIQRSLQNAEELLTTSLEMTKLESGNLQAMPSLIFNQTDANHVLYLARAN